MFPMRINLLSHDDSWQLVILRFSGRSILVLYEGKIRSEQSHRILSICKLRLTLKKLWAPIIALSALYLNRFKSWKKIKMQFQTNDLMKSLDFLTPLISTRILRFLSLAHFVKSGNLSSGLPDQSNAS